MRKRRAPGCDAIEAELIHALDSELFEQLYAIVQRAWLEKVPQQWKDAYIVNLKKKADNPEDWRHCDKGAYHYYRLPVKRLRKS